MHQVMPIDMEKDLLEANRKLAAENHDLLGRSGVRSFDLMGSIGSGKTLLIQRLCESLGQRGIRCGAVLGDVMGDDDFKRISALGIPAVSLNTGKECHLDAHLTEHALEGIDLGSIDVLFIENVGNLVCPADFPLGTDSRIVVISVTEGDDMVRKHPLIFKEADIIVINKSDLASIMEVDVNGLVSDARTVKPSADVVITNAKTGEGVQDLIKALGI